MMVKPKAISGPFQTISFTVITWNLSQTARAERRIISYSTEIYRRYQVYRYILGCNVGENNDDSWNVDGDRELSDTSTGFTRFTLLNEKPTDEYTWSGERLTRKQTTSWPVTLWPEIWKGVSDASKRKEKQKWEPKLDNARRLRGIHFIDPEDEEFKLTMKNARRTLEIPMPAAMPCKTSLCRSSRETCRTVGERKTKYACIVEANESMRIRMEGAPHRYYEDHIAGKVMNSLSRCNLVHKFLHMPQVMKIPDAKAAVDNYRKLEKYRHGI